MPASRDVGAVVREVVGSSGDQDVIEYVIGVLEDESFEFGDDAIEASEALGPLLVSIDGITNPLLSRTQNTPLWGTTQT